MKKLLIIIILLVTAAVGFYFGYWTNTPAYAAGEIQQAVQKKDLIRELIRRTELKFQAKEVPDSSLMDKPLKSITAYIGSAALSMTDVLDVEEKDGLAFANIKLHDKKLDQDFLWRVQLEKDPNNKWTAVKIVNLKEYMEKRKELLKNQVEF